jgi:hypothetical protein
VNLIDFSKMAVQQVLVRSESGLATLTQDAPYFTTRRARIQIDSLLLSPEEVALWQRRLERLYNECGCTASALCLLLAAAGALTFLFMQNGGIRATKWWQIGLALAFVIAAGVVGKMFGLWRARVRLRRASSELQRLMQKRKAA